MTELVRPRPMSQRLRDPVAEADYTCARIDETDGELAAFEAEDDRAGRLRKQAGALAAAGQDSRSPLFGVTVGVKDVIHVDGLETRAGSRVPAPALAGPQAALVDRLMTAGAVIAGKTTCAEFAISAPGPTRNPHDPRHTPGGSSSGSAAAVAAGQVALSIGTQTVSSTIRPAAYCGIVGFKPSFGRIPVDGTIANAPSLDTIGLLSADVAGSAAASEVLCDEWSTARPETLPVLGIPSDEYLSFAERPALAKFAEHLNVLRAAGYRVVRGAAITSFAQFRAAMYTIQRYESAVVHSDWFDRYGELYQEKSAQSVIQGREIDEEKYQLALTVKSAFHNQTHQTMESSGVDLWIGPSATGPAPRGLESTGNSVMSVPWSLIGMPSLSIPAPSNGLPLGFHCVARFGDDERLLAWGAGIEARLRGE
ncbi:MAG: amidase [Stackebrandtia sp.]